MGTLQITGTLDPKQFFPGGESDGDTAHVLVKDFAYSENGGQYKTINLFEGAYVVGRGKKSVIDNKGRIDIRFQGIDAPELHFRPTFQKLPTDARERVNQANKNFRQFFGETAGAELGIFVKSLNNGSPVDCLVVTDVEHPNDVCDTYGRVVADIIADPKGKNIDLNHWMAEKGWAFPAFYNSMTRAEIAKFQDLAQNAQAAQAGIWEHLSSTVGFPDPGLVFQKGQQHQPDSGPVIFPKYFRRACTWYVSVEGGLMEPGEFLEFLQAQKTPDQCYLTDEFLHNGAASSYLHELAEFFREDGRVTQPPGGLVFKEAKSTLYDANDKRIESWQPAPQSNRRATKPPLAAANKGI